MIDSSYIFNLTTQHFASLASRADETEYFEEQKLLSNEAYSEVTYELRGVIFDLEKANYQKDEKTAEKLRQRKKELTKQKQKLYDQLSTKKTASPYHCNVCNDTGFLQNGDYCHCFFEKMTDFALKVLDLKHSKLNTFDDDTLSEKNNQAQLYQKLKLYSQNFSEQSKSLILAGNVGSGKTFAASAIASHIDKKNFNVIFLTALDLSKILLKYHLAQEYDKQLYIEILTTCDLLVVDDLGTEPIYKNVSLEYMLSIFSERQNLGKPFIVTTNLSFELLLSRYGERLYSRLTGKNVTVIPFYLDKSLRNN